MFEKFGEFNGAKELNKAAAGLLEEGDTESIFLLAEENGIEREDAEDYIAGGLDELASISSAAYGRLYIEEQEMQKGKDLSTKAAMGVIYTMLKGMCTDTQMAKAVTKKGKRAENVLKAMKKGAEAHKSGSMGVSCGTDRQLCGIIRAYYLGSKKELDTKVGELYEGVGK